MLRLARIISSICHDFYPTHPVSYDDQVVYAERLNLELHDWKNALPTFLDPAKVHPSILIPIFRRQSTVLNLAYAHALILANRPFSLSNFADLTQSASPVRSGVEEHVTECIDAALLVVNTLNDFVEQGAMHRTFWFTQYISFCATATLYVYAIRQRQNQPSTTGDTKSPHMQYFEAAEKCQRLIATAVGDNSPNKRYSIILDELKREVLERLEGDVRFSNGFLCHSINSQYNGGGSKEGQHTVLHHDTQSFVANDRTKDADGVSSLSIGNSFERVPQDPNAELAPINHMSFDNEVEPDPMSMNFDPSFIGWPELDSWVRYFPMHKFGLL